jgi:DNA segregation ATPase FtsK/SpoIIIE, S-DNA-T family
MSMARSERARSAGNRADAGLLQSPFVREAGGLGLLAIAIFSAIALWSYAPGDPLWSADRVANRGGRLGVLIAAGLFDSIGIAAYLLVAVVSVLGGRLLAGRGLPPASARLRLAIPLLLFPATTMPPLLGAALPRFAGLSGGSLGEILAAHESWALGNWGALLVNALAAGLGALAVTHISLERAIGGAGLAIAALVAFAFDALAGAGQTAVAAARASRRALMALGGGLEEGWRNLGVWRERRARRVRVAAQRPPEPAVEAATDEVAGELPVASPDTAAPARPARKGPPQIVDHAEERAARGLRQESFAFRAHRPHGPYRLPDVAMFQEPPRGARTYDRDSLIMNSRILEKKLSDFGVGGNVVKVHPGPVVTMYEFEPASGIKVQRIVSLQDDLALALRALSVRIIAPLPGKAVVGVEVANAERETVYLRELLESEKFRDSDARLPVALGKDIFGNPVDADLAKMPHLLVAGATGTGKSVFLNSLLCSILCRRTPDELKLLLIDPKLLELSIYAGIPHLIADVVTNPKRASAALAGIVRKMEERYQLMAALGVRSIQQFNERCEKELTAGNKTFRLKPRPGEEEEGLEVEYHPLSYIVVVIDELADLMVVCAKDVEESLQRLAQMARAAGIHLVLATQRPSVDVLTGVIKANFPARISFQVSSKIDSRTVLDQNGADQLLGSGDMLFLPPGTSKMQRLHGAFVTEEEVGNLTGFLRELGAPCFEDDLVRIDVESEDRNGSAEDVDEMYDQAVALVAQTRNASISYVQRRLKIGYNRAARIVEHMEHEGVVGPQIGTKPREVFVSALES